MDNPSYIQKLLAERSRELEDEKLREQYELEQDHLKAVAARTTSREKSFFSQKPREECKNKKIKKQKHISRLSEESNGTGLSDSLGIASREDRLVAQEERVVDVAARENITSRAYSGIEAFHNKTPKGVKLSLAIQSLEDAKFGACVKLTAELKRQDRFREIVDYEGDDEDFREYVRYAKQFYQKDKSADWCMGRVHARGKRDAWFGNILVIAQLVDNVVTRVKIQIDAELYEFDMQLDLNDNQKEFYHTGGRYGSIKSVKRVPTLKTAERVLYK